MLYKYLFYSVSFLVKRYDRYWKVGDTYFVGGAMTVGMVISLSLINIMDIIGAAFYNERVLLRFPTLTYLPLVLGLVVILYLSYKKRHCKVYTEVAHLNETKKRIYKTLNIIHIALVFGVFLNMNPILEFFDLI